MKLLENTTFDALASALSVDNIDCRIEARLESYSCKLVVQEKKLWKGLGGSPHEREALSPPQADIFYQLQPPLQIGLSRSVSSDPENESGVVLRDSISRKTLFYLTATLNASFPDYDFSDVRGEQFSREHSVNFVMKSLDNKLRIAVPNYEQYRQQLWTAVDKEIIINECSIYMYTPDYNSDSDPFSSDGALWSYIVFFYNKKLKRVVFLACRALSQQAEVVPDEYQTQWSMEEDYSA